MSESGDGHVASSTIGWTGPAAFTLTIVDTGVPSEAGTQRQFHRQ